MSAVKKLTIFFLITCTLILFGCDPSIGGDSGQSIDDLTPSDRVLLLTEIMYASGFAKTKVAESEGAASYLADAYAYEYSLTQEYELAYRAVFGEKPKYITAGALCDVTFVRTENEEASTISLSELEQILEEIELESTFDRESGEYSFVLNGEEIDVTGVELPDFSTMAGATLNYFRVRFLTPETDEEIFSIVFTEGIVDIFEYNFNSGSESYRPDVGQLVCQKFVEIFHPDMDIDPSLSEEMLFILPADPSLALSDTWPPEGDFNIALMGVLYSNTNTGEISIDPDAWMVGFGTTEYPNKQYDALFFEYDYPYDKDEFTEFDPLTIVSFGEPGEALVGVIVLGNQTLYERADDSEYYQKHFYKNVDVLIDFSVLRAEDYILSLRKLSVVHEGEEVFVEYMYEGENCDVDWILSSLKFQLSGIFNNVIGFSKSPDSKEVDYIKGGTILIEDEDIVLYPVLIPDFDPPLDALQPAEFLALLTEVMFASDYAYNKEVEKNGTEFLLQDQYAYSCILTGAYESDYEYIFEEKPTFITAGSHCDVTFERVGDEETITNSFTELTFFPDGLEFKIIVNTESKECTFLLNGTEIFVLEDTYLDPDY